MRCRTALMLGWFLLVTAAAGCGAKRPAAALAVPAPPPRAVQAADVAKADQVRTIRRGASDRVARAGEQSTLGSSSGGPAAPVGTSGSARVVVTSESSEPSPLPADRVSTRRQPGDNELRMGRSDPPAREPTMALWLLGLIGVVAAAIAIVLIQMQKRRAA